MRYIYLIFLFCSVTLWAQNKVSIDSLKLNDVNDFFADDYGNLYLYKTKDFSFTKYDSVGNQLGKMMMTVPFKIQNVQNPLNIVLFSENSQEVRLVDQNLNDIQKIDLTKRFGFIKAAYVEDQQMIWLLDDSTKRLIQMNYRDDRVINSFPQYWSFEEVVDLLVFENKMYVLTESEFVVRNLRGDLLFQKPIVKSKRLRRENDRIYIITQNEILKYDVQGRMNTEFSKEYSKIVDKNSSAFFELKGNNLYLYTSQKTDND